MKLPSTFALGDNGRPAPRSYKLIHPANLACLAVLGCLALPVLAHAQAKQSSGVRSTQLVQHEDGAMVVYNVILDRRFDLGELDTLSHRIKRTAPKTKLIFISYFLRGMKPEQEAWATSHFNPQLDSFVVRINESITATNPPDTDLRIAASR